MIYLIDFGSQTTHLISRRIKELGSPVVIVSPDQIVERIQKEKPQGIILSGGPASVYQKGVPTLDRKIFEQKIPILGICYGLQLMAQLLGGRVIPGKKEYGPATLTLKSEYQSTKIETNSNDKNSKSFEFRISNFDIASGLPKTFVVWMSHGDEVVKLPEGFEVLGSTEHVPFAFVADQKRKIFGLQFHPEVEHTEWGRTILGNFVALCNIEEKEHEISLAKLEEEIKKEVGENYVIGAVSGGVDSAVAGLLCTKAIGKRFIPVYVDNGLMRVGTKEHVKKIFTKKQVSPIVVSARGEMLRRLKGIIDPEKKRKIIGNFYIEVFEKEMKKLLKSGKKVKFLLQGTIYSDVIESKGTKHAAKIKSHHNVGGLPKKMKLKLLEPLRHFYKDEVRQIGKKLGLQEEFVHKQPFPGPGYAIRIRGEVTRARLKKEKQADKIVLEELEKAGILNNVFQSFPVLTGAYSTAVKGDGRHFGEVVALRVVESKDIMTSKWSRLPYDVLQRISSRIVNEVLGVSRVVYDITTKPPATMEWE